jgi:hypothetical protein
MISRVGRLAGAILARSGKDCYLVGNTKEPCDWAAAGFEPPGEIDALARPYQRLSALRDVAIGTPRLELALEGEALPRLLASAFVIERTGMVSERLWRLAIGDSDEQECPPDAVIAGDWLAQMPPAIWTIVRDNVLRCS